MLADIAMLMKLMEKYLILLGEYQKTHGEIQYRFIE
jgi:hypothetical protein